LKRYGIVARYNVIKKQVFVDIPNHKGTPDNKGNVASSHILSLAAKHGMSTNLVGEMVSAVADLNAYNPIRDWVESEPWDGVSRLKELYATVKAAEGYPEPLKVVLLYRWLLSAAAAVLKEGFHSRGVLTFQGKQGIGKSSWLKALVPPQLRDDYVKLSLHLDPSNKDSVLTAVGHWMCELGELDSTLKRDIGRLKGFVTERHDKVRRPYAKADSVYPRRTVFFATVNEAEFLIDTTGNSRFWTIAVEGLDFEHGIDMQQVFAELATLLSQGERWWLTPEEEAQLAQQNEQYRSSSVVRDNVIAIIDMGLSSDVKRPALTASEVLRFAGFREPTNPQTKECGAVLRELLGDPKKVNGSMKWRVPLIEEIRDEIGGRRSNAPDDCVEY
jgi:putative DNA primase/helicase